jgi:hypothetical protein
MDASVQCYPADLAQEGLGTLIFSLEKSSHSVMRTANSALGIPVMEFCGGERGSSVGISPKGG